MATGARLGTVDIAVSAAGIYTSVFAVPYVIPANMYTQHMVAMIWDTAGLKYPKATYDSAFPAYPPLPFMGGSRICWLNFGRFAAADGPPTSQEGPMFAVEPVLELV
jgi:hypothetical protein